MSFKSDIESLILGVLQHGPLHGYEISKRIKSLTSKALSVGEGQLYPCLHGLEADGHIKAEWVPQDGKPDRKVYSLTDSGKGKLAEKWRAWEQFCDAVDTVLAPAPTTLEAHHG